MSIEIVNSIAMCKIFWDYLWCLLNIVYFFQDILQLIMFCFCHRYFRIQHNCSSKNYLLLLIDNNFVFLYDQKGFLISVSILSLIALISFSSLKRFLISLIIFYFLGLGFSIIICYEKNNFFKKEYKSIILL